MTHGLWRLRTSGGVRLARGNSDTGPVELLAPDARFDDVVRVGEPALRALLAGPGQGPVPSDATVLAPVDSQPVWASGVTFERSRTARREESGGSDVYDRVYDADRPELFVKAFPGTVRGPGEPIGVRADSTWDVPEPEIGLVADAMGRLLGYTVANDVSSRSIEGENPLYLPQAKLYRGSCALGPCLVPANDLEREQVQVRLRIRRRGQELFDESVPLQQMRRTPEELLDWLFRGLDFPHGVVLLSGTSIVPPPELTLRAADEVTVEVTGLGALVNTVEVVDTAPRRHDGDGR